MPVDPTEDQMASATSDIGRPQDTQPSRPQLGADLTRTHYPHLDGLRGLAVMSVMAYHFCLPHRHFHDQSGAWWIQIAQAGWMGVDLFFVLSGFLITGILVETRGHAHYFRNFLVRRFLRIWPLYYLSLAVLLIALPMLLPSVPPQLLSMKEHEAWFWLYAANWLFAREGGFTTISGGFYWSLAVEEQFYLLWPLVVYALSDKGLLRVALALFCLSLVLRVVLDRLGVSSNSLYVSTFTHLDGLAVGSTLAIAIRLPKWRARVVRWFPAAAAAAAVGLFAIRALDGNAFFWSRGMATFGYSCVAVLFGALLLWMLKGGRTFGLSALFNSAFMRRGGKYSYALYLVHVPMASALIPLLVRKFEPLQASLGYDAAFLACVLIAFVASWFVAVLSWHVFEKRILELKRYVSYESGGDRAASPTVPGSVANRPLG